MRRPLPPGLPGRGPTFELRRQAPEELETHRRVPHRSLTLGGNLGQDGVLLEEKTCRSVLRYATYLWGYGVKLLEIEASTDKVLKTYESEAQ